MQTSQLNNPPAVESKLSKLRDRAFSDMNYIEYIKNHGAPPAPFFKPQLAPTEGFGDMELPPSEAADKDYREVLSCPTAFKIIQETESSDEEEERDRFDVPEKGTKGKHVGNNQGGAPEVDEFFIAPRYRSRSENLHNGSILKFMETKVDGRRDQANIKFFF